MTPGGFVEVAATLPAAAEIAATTAPELASVVLDAVPAESIDAARQLAADFEVPNVDPASLIEDFAETPVEVQNATPLPEQKSTTPAERMNTYIEKSMQKWEADNLMPSRDVDPDKFEQWQTKKVDHMKRMEVEAQFHEDIRTWAETNVDPGDKDPEGHRQWEKDREAHKKELKAAQESDEPAAENEDEQTDEEAEDEAEKVLTNPENEAKLKALRELYQKRAVLLGERNGLSQAIATGKQAGANTAKAEALLIDNGGKLSKIDADIQRLEAELKITGTKAGSLVKTILKILGAVGVSGVLLAVSGAKSA